MGKIEDEIRQKKFENVYQKLAVNILFTNNWIVAIQQQVLKPFGLTYQQYNVLRILKGKHPEACTAKEIKEVMIDKKPDLTRMFDRLQKKGLITRGIDSNNRSKLAVRLTEAGLDILQSIYPETKKIYDALGSLTKEEAGTLSNLLDKLRT